MSNDDDMTALGYHSALEYLADILAALDPSGLRTCTGPGHLAEAFTGERVSIEHPGCIATEVGPDLDVWWGPDPEGLGWYGTPYDAKGDVIDDMPLLDACHAVPTGSDPVAVAVAIRAALPGIAVVARGTARSLGTAPSGEDIADAVSATASHTVLIPSDPAIRGDARALEVARERMRRGIPADQEALWTTGDTPLPASPIYYRDDEMVLAAKPMHLYPGGSVTDGITASNDGPLWDVRWTDGINVWHQPCEDEASARDFVGLLLRAVAVGECVPTPAVYTLPVR
jgi:hypothetical protein